MLLVPEPVVPVELMGSALTVPEVVAAPVALVVPVVLVVASAAWTGTNTLAMDKAAAAVVIIALDTFMIYLLELGYCQMPTGTRHA